MLRTKTIILISFLMVIFTVFGCKTAPPAIQPSHPETAPATAPSLSPEEEAKEELDRRAEEERNAAFIKSADDGNVADFELFLDAGMNPDVKAQHGGYTALINSAWNGHTGIVKTLLENGADVNMGSDSGWTALMGAALNCYTRTTKVLLDGGADINAVDSWGKTSLMGAVQNSCTDTVRTLLENGADVNAEDKRGKTALMRTRNKEIIKILRQAGAVE